MASSSTNKDIDYIQKDFSSSLDAMISYANVNYGPGTSANRLWTNFNADSFSRNWLEIVAFVSDVLFYYFDVQATQSYLQTATVRSAVEDIAKQFGFIPATASSASGNAIFTVTAPVTIPRGFKVQATNGIEYYLTNAIVAGGAGEFTGTVLQGSTLQDAFVASGLQNEEFNISGVDVIRDLTNTNPADISPQVTVNGNSYTLVSSFIKHNGTDTAAVIDSLGNVQGGGGRVFTLNKRPDGTQYIKFGDGIFGRKLDPSDSILVTYRTGGGSAGNIPKNTLVSLVSSLSGVTAVNNTGDFSGGADEQSIEQLRELIPASLRTLDRAVAEKDYSDILLANFSEVFSASTERNDEDPGIDLNIYVIPQGTGIVNITDNNLLANRLTSFLERRKTVTIQFQLLDAFGIDSLITLEIFISDTTSKTTVKNAVSTAIKNFFDLSTGGVTGAGIGFAENVLLKDIGDLLDGISGITRYEIKRLSYRPRIDKKTVGIITEYASSEVNIFPNISEAEWLLAAAGPVSETVDSVLFSNTGSIAFSYDSSTGKVSYASEVDLSTVAAGDTWVGGVGTSEKSLIECIGDGTGAQEVSKVITVADVQGTQEITEITTKAGIGLASKFIMLQDLAGSVAFWFNTGSDPVPSHGANRVIEVPILVTDTASQVATALHAAIDGDSEFSAPVPAADIITVTNASKASLPDFADGAAVTTFTFNIIQQGVNPSTLKNSYFDMADISGPVRVWFTVASLGTAPSVPIGGRLLVVDVAANASSNAVAIALQAVIDADPQFNAPAPVGNVLIITDVAAGIRDNITDGALPTKFTFSTTTQGAPATTINTKYWLLRSQSNKGLYYVWYNNTGTPGLGDPLVPGTDAGIEVAISIGATPTAVATATKNAIDAFTLAEVTSMTTVAGNVLQGRYFILYDTGGPVVFWYNIAGGSPTPPVGVFSSRTAIPITTVLATDTSVAVATATAAVIQFDSQFSAMAVGSVVTITSFASTLIDDASPGNSGFTVSVTTQGVDFVATNPTATSVLVDTIFPGVTGDTVDGDSNFTFSVNQQGTDDKAKFTVLGVNNSENYVYIAKAKDVSTTISTADHGSVLNGNTVFQSFKCFKKLLAKATNLSVNSVTDNNLDLSIASGTASSLSARILIDNTIVFVKNQYATGDYFLVDGSGNIWEIVANSSNTITTGITAVNDAAISAVGAGTYKIVTKLVGSEILFNNSIFPVQYNSDNTIYSIGSQFPQIGTIGDYFQISTLQSNVGNLGTPVDIISFDDQTKEVRLNGSPELSGITTENLLIDSSGQVFNVVAVDSRANPSIEYSADNASNEIILAGSGADSMLAQGFQVDETSIYTTVALYIRKEGNIIGTLLARIVEDDGTGLPDLSKVVAISQSLNITTVAEESTKIPFAFANPPELTKDIQYHLILSGDAAYQGAQDNSTITFSNTGLVGYTYSTISSTIGLVTYSGTPNLASVSPGNFFKDNTGEYFKITAIDNTLKTLTIQITATSTPDQIVNTIDDASCFVKDNIHVTYDDNASTYADGTLSSFDGFSLWTASATEDFIFSVEGPKSITVDSNLTPASGPGATISSRYYDDEDEMSLVVGISNGTVTNATNVNAYGKGTVGAIPNSKVDSFVFRTSRIADDIVNLRLNEIPQISDEDIVLNVFGGID